jgi:threonine/homoserine/homoserine lactone efflux protein
VPLLAACAVAFAFGYVGSVPLAGPIAVMVLSRGASGKFGEARRVGLGAAVAEGLYAGAAFWSFTALLARSALLQPLARGATALVLVPLGVRFVLWRSKERTGGPEGKAGTAFLGFSISALNPTLFLTWSAAVAFLFSGQAQPLRGMDAIPFGLSAGAGVALWFLTLVLLLRRYEGRLRRDALAWVVRALGFALLSMGIWSAVGLARWLTHGRPHPLSSQAMERATRLERA